MLKFLDKIYPKVEAPVLFVNKMENFDVFNYHIMKFSDDITGIMGLSNSKKYYNLFQIGKAEKQIKS